VVVTTEGHLLMFSVAELPELDKGKGNKLIEIPKAKLSSGDERVAGVAVVDRRQRRSHAVRGSTQADAEVVRSGRVRRQSRHARRLLPRGLRRVERIETTG
jgi:topoisomerase-4 subunit A